MLISKDSKTFYCSAGGQFSGSLYQCTWNTNRPLKLIKSTPEQIVLLKYSDSGKYILAGTSEGKLQIRMLGHENNFMELPMNGNSGQITNACLNFVDNLAICSNSDGILTVRQLDKEIIECKAKDVRDLPEPCRYRNQESEINLETFDVDLSSKVVKDILNPDVYSIQNDKLKSEHDKLIEEAEKYKENLREIISGLREHYKDVVKQNNSKEW